MDIKRYISNHHFQTALAKALVNLPNLLVMHGGFHLEQGLLILSKAVAMSKESYYVFEPDFTLKIGDSLPNLIDIGLGRVTAYACACAVTAAEPHDCLVGNRPRYTSLLDVCMYLFQGLAYVILPVR